jgi:4-hydroxybenzoate polyprenyltransferase
VLLVYLACVAVALLAWRAAGLGLGFLPFAALFAGHLVWQALRLRMDDPKGALRLFKSNTLAGLLLFCAIVAGRGPAN